MPNAQVGALIIMMQGLLPLRLNCPWRATVMAAMVRSTVSVYRATIGAVQLAARMLATSASLASVPAWTPPIERTDSLYVALRINTFASLGSGTKTQQK